LARGRPRPCGRAPPKPPVTSWAADPLGVPAGARPPPASPPECVLAPTKPQRVGKPPRTAGPRERGRALPPNPPRSGRRAAGVQPWSELPGALDGPGGGLGGLLDSARFTIGSNHAGVVQCWPSPGDLGDDLQPLGGPAHGPRGAT